MLSSLSPILALPKPFGVDGRVDHGALRASAEFLCGAGVSCILCNGTTGEFFSLTNEERASVFNTCRSAFRGTVINHVGATAVSDARWLATEGSQGADALLSVPPYYFAGAPEDGIASFFRETFKGISTPLYLYNFPRHVGNELTPSLVSSVMEDLGSLKGIKESGVPLSHARMLKERFPNLEVYLGADEGAFSSADAGLSGSVSGGGNPLPEFHVAIANAFRAGDREASMKFQCLFDIWNTYRSEHELGEISLVKAALSTRISGYPIYTRAPLVLADASYLPSIAGTVSQLLAKINK